MVEDKEGYSVKVIIVGDGGVGKTSLVNRFVHKKFSNIYKTTIGVDITPCPVRMKATGEPVRFILWDMSGQTHFERFRGRFYSGTSGALIVYDLTSASSYRNVEDWIKECKDNCRKKLPMLIIGNKVDLKDLRVDNARPPSSSREFPIIFTSAKDNFNVDKAFFLLFETIIGEPLELMEDQDTKTTNMTHDSLKKGNT